MQNLIVRPMMETDLKRVRELAKQLGYSCSVDDLKIRFQTLSLTPDHHLVVAESQATWPALVVGFAHFKKHVSLLVEPQLEIAGLVVDERYRGRGIGRILVEESERVASDWGVGKIRLTSNVKRVDAHKFYFGLGFSQPKTSHYFEKPVVQADEHPRQESVAFTVSSSTLHHVKGHRHGSGCC